MTDETSTGGEIQRPSGPTALAPAHGPRKKFLARAMRWGAELFTVFFGVYAAFMLNSYQGHRQERQRREQILAWMETDFTGTLEEVKREQVSMREQADDFDRRVAAGDMPAIHAFSFTTDYDPSDTASVLSGGGVDLMEVETVRQIKDTEATLRLMIGLARHDQQLSDALILPNLEKDPSFFYDPATHKLRPTYGWYADFFPKMMRSFDTLRSALEKLLAQIRAERQRNR